jgi:OOP family OmpA-OmpF porin
MTNTTRKRAELVLTRALGLCLLTASPGLALELDLPSGARETATEVSEAGRYDLPIAGWSEESGIPVATLDGHVMRKAWRISVPGLTTGQVIAPLRDQLLKAGYDIFFECATRSCGGFEFRFGTDVLNAPAMYVDLSDFRFLSAKGPDAGDALSLLVSRDDATVFVQLVLVGPAGRVNVSTNATTTTTVRTPVEVGDVVAQLENLGHVVLADLEFASGSASLGDGPLGSLDALTDYLIANPTREITFVGHTDATGSLEANVALSRRRADAARAYVIARGVPDAQVASDGVGFLSPRSSNLTADGREANRRVEAVLISTE